jgi:hypothetical protein
MGNTGVFLSCRCTDGGASGRRVRKRRGLRARGASVAADFAALIPRRVRRAGEGSSSAACTRLATFRTGKRNSSKSLATLAGTSMKRFKKRCPAALGTGRCVSILCVTSLITTFLAWRPAFGAHDRAADPYPISFADNDLPRFLSGLRRHARGRRKFRCSRRAGRSGIRARVRRPIGNHPRHHLESALQKGRGHARQRSLHKLCQGRRRDIPPGRPFAEVIKERLDEAKCVVVLWSKHSTTSHWVKDEASRGLDRNVLVPALVDHVAIPLGFGQTHAADLVGWNGARDEEGFHAFLNSVRSLTRPESKERARKPARVSLWRRILHVITIAVLALFSLAIVSTTCANPDNVVLSIIAGLPVAAFLVLRVRRSPRFLWFLAPVITWAMASPIGRGYGEMTESALSGSRPDRCVSSQAMSTMCSAGCCSSPSSPICSVFSGTADIGDGHR